jgi:metallo-beta-lactamase family protein
VSDFSLQFLGAAKTVTGSRILLNLPGGGRYLVDCGLFQGPKNIRERNWQSHPDLLKLDGIILTHAHIDHSGYLPRLVKEGYKGPIYASPATADLCRIMLLDAAHLQEEDARFANMTQYSHHSPAIPLFDTKDAEQALSQFRATQLHREFELAKGIRVQMIPSGHMLGSTYIHMTIDAVKRSILFSGDIGNGRSQVIKPPEKPPCADYVVMEATYGDRCQPRTDPLNELEPIIKKVLGRGGTLVVPAFSVGRTQELLYLIATLEREGRINPVAVYLDSPMALDATELYLAHQSELRQHNGFGPFAGARYTSVRSTDDSMLLCMNTDPKIVISAAGMLTGGRILHHLKARLPDEKSGVLFVGYQAEGTKGRLLKHGLTQIRIHHQPISVEAEIFSIDSLSAHADSDDLVKWAAAIQPAPAQIFLNHGEQLALEALAYRLRHENKQRVLIAEADQIYPLE